MQKHSYLSLLVAIALPFTPGIVYAEEQAGTVEIRSIESRRVKGKARSDASRAVLSALKSGFAQEREHAKYLAGDSSVNAVIDASLAHLRSSLSVGIDRHASRYDAQIAELEDVVRQKLGVGTATERDLREVRDARLDAIVATLFPQPADQ